MEVQAEPRETFTSAGTVVHSSLHAGHDPSALLARTLAGTSAQYAWLACAGQTTSLSARRGALAALPLLVGLPEPPDRPLLITGGADEDGWSEWCRVRGIRSCAVAPINPNGKAIGTIGLISTTRLLGSETKTRVEWAAWVAAFTHTYGEGLRAVEQQVEGVLGLLDGPLALARAFRANPSYHRLIEAIGKSLDATYCRLVVRDESDRLVIKASGGHRLAGGSRGRAPLLELSRCAEALRLRRPIVMQFDRQNVPDRERRLFSPATRTAIIVPFSTEGSPDGVLLVGEEREGRSQSWNRAQLGVLEFLAQRITDILRTNRFVEDVRASERRRRARHLLSEARVQLARDLHDDVGQALNALLIRIRCAIGRDPVHDDELRVLESAAQDALGAARSLAYGLRRPDANPLLEALQYSRALLETVGCRLTWSDERPDPALARGVAQEIARVVKESVTNIVKHARAGAVQIRLESIGDQVRISIYDDGVGFAPAGVTVSPDGRGLGLLGNSERMTRLGGGFWVHSAPNAGTLVIIEAPAH